MGFPWEHPRKNDAMKFWGVSSTTIRKGQNMAALRKTIDIIPRKNDLNYKCNQH